MKLETQRAVFLAWGVAPPAELDRLVRGTPSPTSTTTSSSEIVPLRGDLTRR